VAAEFCVQNLGCKVNRVESDTICAELLAAGGRQTTRDRADVIVINTCTVTAEADAKARKEMRRSLDAAKKPWVIATGCATAIRQETYQQLGSRLIVEPDRLKALQKAAELLGLKTSAAPDDHTAIRCGGEFRTRVGIKIQDGCDNACSYCVVPAARGKAQSMHPGDIIRQAEIADSEGIGELVITGVNIGAYSHGELHLAALLRLLLDSTSQLRIRLSSLEPQHLSDDIIEMIAGSQARICAHLHLPLQSGCDRTLREMGRHYNCASFEERLRRAQKAMPHIAVSTDVIVGFPGESEQDFCESLQFCERMGFSRMHVFRYSKRPGTPASMRTDQIAAQVSNARAAKMRELARSLELQDVRSRLKTTESVLVEGDGRGRSESYHQVLLPTDARKGSLVMMRFTDHRDKLLSGEILST